MKQFRRLVVVVPAVVLVGLLVLLFLGRGTMEQLAFLRREANGGGNSLVDQSPFETAHTLAGQAVSAEEQGFAQEAERLADHEVDQAFAAALRQASLRQRTLSPAAAALAVHVAELKDLVKADQAQVDAAVAAAKTSGIAAVEGDEVDVAKAQLGLDTDELTDAVGDLARESGDQRGKIQAELAAREAAMKQFDSGAGGPKTAAVDAARKYGTLLGRANAWFDQRSRAKLIAEARVKAEGDVREFAGQHAALAGKEAGIGDTGALEGKARVKVLEERTGRRVLMSILDDRMQTEQQLATVYTRWEKQVWRQHRFVGYLLLQSFAWVALIILLAALGALLGSTLIAQTTTDARRARTLETLVTLAAEGVGLIGVLVVVFGVPDHTPTVIGLATAGLTVVFQDFIIAFCGWFVLMGRNGIRVGDWVEISGVGGEVTEIGLFRTRLMETGNWTSRGHPTGRKVAFMNSYAVRGQFFNFSTHGQWMWDEIKLNVPATATAYELTKRMQVAVEKTTAKDTEQAEHEWQNVTRKNGMSHFSATPTVDLRPAASGVDVLVRFVTRASERFEMRRKLYEELLGMMEGTERLGVGAEETSGIA